MYCKCHNDVVFVCCRRHNDVVFVYCRCHNVVVFVCYMRRNDVVVVYCRRHSSVVLYIADVITTRIYVLQMSQLCGVFVLHTSQ